MPALESNFLVPNGTFMVFMLVCSVLFGVLVVWPLVETVVRQQWGYTLAVVFLGPIGGLVWFLGGRSRTARPHPARARQSGADAVL